MKINPIQAIKDKASIQVPGDKSISHRAVLFSGLQESKSKITHILLAEDVRNHIQAFAQMGATCHVSDQEVSISGLGLPLPPRNFGTLDMGNSGTAMRLLAGALAGSPGAEAMLIGDSSLMKRPMRRIAEPLNAFGADVQTSTQGTGPLIIKGRQMRPVKWVSSIASAQVKSSLMFAAMASQVDMEYIEPMQSRDHTERFLEQLGIQIQASSAQEISGLREKKIFADWSGQVSDPVTDWSRYYQLKPPYTWQMKSFDVPGDISSAAFFIVLAAIVPGNGLSIVNVGLNPSRRGILQAMEMMGVQIAIEQQNQKGEPRGNLHIAQTKMQGTVFSDAIIPNIIDEIPILAVAAAFARGKTEFLGVEELRHKESDRIQAICENLEACGVATEQWADGFCVYGQTQVLGGTVQSFQDHRIAMAFTVLGLASQKGVTIDDISWVETSFPGFYDKINLITEE